MQSQLDNYVERIVQLIATHEGACARNRKIDKIEFWIGRPNYTIVVPITYKELERCMNLACYPESLIKYIE